jgi:excisionase family DNA binding protein
MPLAASLLTADDLAPIQALLRQILAQQTAAAQPADDYLSVAQVAQLTGTSEKTVRKWISQGKYDTRGQLIRLYTLEFSPGFPRVPRSALLAFGQSIGFEATQLALPPAGGKAPVLDSAKALRRAS